MAAMQEQTIHWKGAGLTRIPFSLYSDTALPEQEQERIFRGNTWNFLCLDAEIQHMLGRQNIPHPDVLAVFQRLIFVACSGDSMKAKLTKQRQ